jgi:hypothetical protein
MKYNTAPQFIPRFLRNEWETAMRSLRASSIIASPQKEVDDSDVLTPPRLTARQAWFSACVQYTEEFWKSHDNFRVFSAEIHSLPPREAQFLPKWSALLHRDDNRAGKSSSCYCSGAKLSFAVSHPFRKKYRICDGAYQLK